MYWLPDLNVWETGNQYQDAAALCHKHHLGWPAAINAALSIEIYLKSFLAHQILVSDGISKQGFSDTDRGHDLHELYQKISPDLRQLMESKYKDLAGNDLHQNIYKYKDIFLHARYHHESKSIQVVNSEIVHFSADMRALVIEASKVLHPKVITPLQLNESD